MKKLLLFFVGFVLSMSLVQSQHFSKGTGVLSTGLGIGDRLVKNNYSTVFPPVFLSYEHGILDPIWLGQIGIGGVVSTSAASYRDRWFQSSGYNYTFITMGFRAAYHVDFFELTGQSFFKDFDIYAGLYAGYTMTLSSAVGGYTGTAPLASTFGPEAFVGVRYYFMPATAVMLEASPIGINFLKAGFSFRL